MIRLTEYGTGKLILMSAQAITVVAPSPVSDDKTQVAANNVYYFVKETPEQIDAQLLAAEPIEAPAPETTS